MLTESKLQDSLLKNAPNSMKRGNASTARSLGTSRRIAALANNKEEELLQDRTHRVDRVTKTIHRKGKAPAPRSRPQARPAKIEEVVDDRDLPEDTEAQIEEPPPYDLKRAETMIRTMKAEDRVKLLENISFLEGF
jgi:hypothetical protein